MRIDYIPKTRFSTCHEKRVSYALRSKMANALAFPVRCPLASQQSLIEWLIIHALPLPILTDVGAEKRYKSRQALDESRERS
jgi:hypothetical protein